ncbi:ZZ-type zinc finger-containing protein 3 [Chytriomyces hyalinus]|nr:ZZ-type zinc finger-containing protein 3 [Chytriomyces hyalinus]
MAPTTQQPHSAQPIVLVLSRDKVPSVKPCYCPPDTPRDRVIRQSYLALLDLFATTKVHPNRLIYAMAGMIYTLHAPAPFGGVHKFSTLATDTGTTANELLLYTVTRGFDHYFKFRDRGALKCIVARANKVLHYQTIGLKDALDEAMLKGMKKAGRITTYSAVVIPETLKHVDESSDTARVQVEFMANRHKIAAHARHNMPTPFSTPSPSSSASLEEIDATDAVLKNTLQQNAIDLIRLKELMDKALEDPVWLTEGLRNKSISVPEKLNIVAVPRIDFDNFALPVQAEVVASDADSQAARMDLFEPVHYQLFPDIKQEGADSAEPEFKQSEQRYWSKEEKELFKKLLEKYPPEQTHIGRAQKISAEFPSRTIQQISSQLGRLMQKGDLFGDSLLRDVKLSELDPMSNKARTLASGSIYIGTQADEMEMSDSEVSDIDIDPILKNSDQYMELMRLKSLAKLRELEEKGSVSKTGTVHHNVSCNACGNDPIVGIRWRCKDCPEGDDQVDLCNECIKTDYQNDLHKLSHDFEKMENPEPWTE